MISNTVFLATSINLADILINSSVFIFNQVYYGSKLDCYPNMEWGF